MARRSGGSYPQEESDRRLFNSELDVPPQSPEAERALIGALLKFPHCAVDIIGNVDSSDFASANHQAIWESIEKLYHDGKHVDLVTVGENLAKRKLLTGPNGIGGAPVLAQLHEDCLTAVGCTQHAAIIREKALLRTTIAVLNEGLKSCKSPNASAEETVCNIERDVMGILERRSNTNCKEIGALVATVMNDIKDRQQRPGSVSGVTLPWFGVSNIVPAMLPGHLVYVGGLQGNGKSSFMSNIVEHVAINCGLPVLVVSLEVPELAFAERMLTLRAGVDGMRLRRGLCNSQEHGDLLAAANDLTESKLLVDDRQYQTVQSIGSVARRMKQRGGLGLVGIDYLGLLKNPNGRRSSRYEDVSDVAEDLKRLANDLRVPVLVLAQLSRDCAKRPGQIPKVSDLRDSGQVEASADTIFLISCADTWNPEAKRGEMLCQVGKQRSGPTGECVLHFDKATGRIVDATDPNSPFGVSQDGF